MATFFMIFLALVFVNAALLIHSSISANRRATKASTITEAPEIKIYPIDLLPSNYKKAI